MDELGGMIWELADALKLVEKKEVECCGVTPYQGFLLMKLLERRGMAMQELAREMGVAVSTMTRNVDKLEDKEMVRREQSDQDARSLKVTLTDAGEDTAARIASSWDGYFVRLRENMSPEETKQAHSGIRILLQAIRRTGNCCE
jgi:DNA-binding MarR family transcriptional regulator